MNVNNHSISILEYFAINRKLQIYTQIRVFDV